MKLLCPQTALPLIEARLRSEFPQIHVIALDEEGTPLEPAADAEVFLRYWTRRPIYERVLRETSGLRWVHTPSAGVDGLLSDELRRGITLTNSAGAHAIPIAEFVLMFILFHAKQVPALLQAQRERQWPDPELSELTDQTLLIIGLGQIGQAIARRAAAFGMRVIGSRQHPQPMPDVELVVGANDWRELLAEADYVVIATPLTAQTRGMIDQAAFRAMRRSAYLINIARGAIIDEPALIDALQAGLIAGAGLDALAQEPLPAESPLWDLPGVFITPHTSWSSPHTLRRSLEIFFENLRRYCNGEALRNVVNLDLGY